MSLEAFAVVREAVKVGLDQKSKANRMIVSYTCIASHTCTCRTHAPMK